MADEFRDIKKREGTLVSIMASASVHKRLWFFSNDGLAETEDRKIIGFLDDAFDIVSADPSNSATSRHFAFTLDNDLNPEHAIGEKGIFFRHSTGAGLGDLDLILIDDNSGVFATVSPDWPKFWWDDSESAFTIGTPAVNANFQVYGECRIENNLNHPVLKITAKDDDIFDPQIRFLVGATPAVKFSMGVDADDNDSFKLFGGSGIGDTVDFVISSTGQLGLGTKVFAADPLKMHISEDASVEVPSSKTILAIETNETSDKSRYIEFLGPSSPSTATMGVAFSKTGSSLVGLFEYVYASDTMEFTTNSAIKMRLNATGLGIGTAPSFKIHMSESAAQCYLDQSGTTGAVAPLALDQADIDIQFADFIGTSENGLNDSLIDFSDSPGSWALGSVIGLLKVNITDSRGAGITDGTYYVPFYTPMFSP